VDVAEVLRERWDLKPSELEVLTGGMNSAVWLASTGEWRVVVKAVGLGDTAFGPGLELTALSWSLRIRSRSGICWGGCTRPPRSSPVI
jgi:hypothetical protein